MKIHTTGLPVKFRKYRNDIKKATEFFGMTLMGSRLADNVDVEIVFNDATTNESGNHGECLADDCEDAPRFFTININSSLSYKTSLIAIAHEMVHVKQYAKKEYKNYVIKKNQSLCRWHKEIIDIDKVSYWDQPWEIEAFGRELGLYVRYMESKKKVKKT